MSRASLWIGFLAGGWLATALMILLPSLGLRIATAEDPPAVAPPESGQPVQPGPTVNPINPGFTPRGVPAASGGGTSDSNGHAIALSASIGGGESVVYYFDTVKERLLIYQYRGIIQGNKPLDERDKGGLRLLAARHFDYDLRLEGYRDLSQNTRNQLKKLFEKAFVEDEDGSGGGLPTKKVGVPGGFK